MHKGSGALDRTPWPLIIAALGGAAVGMAFFLWFSFYGGGRAQETSMSHASVLSPRQPRTSAVPQDVPNPPAFPPGSPEVATTDTISEILADPSGDHGRMIQSLLAALPYLDEKKQEEAANHIANLSSNALVAVWSGPLVENRLPKVAAETLYDRLLNFAPDVSFPVLARIADLPSHPMRQETIDMFQILMDEPPPGGKWGDWIKAKRPSN